MEEDTDDIKRRSAAEEGLEAMAASLVDGLGEESTPLCEQSAPVSETPPNPASPLSTTEKPSADPAASNPKKKTRGKGAKAFGWSGMQKPKEKARQPKGKQVRFKTPLTETLLIDFESAIVLDPSIAAGCDTSCTPAAIVPAAPPKTRGRGSKKGRATVGGKTTSRQQPGQAHHLEEWTVFGGNHIPTRYEAVVTREAELQAKEAEVDREYGYCSQSSHDVKQRS
jgi:hypothetical protein